MLKHFTTARSAMSSTLYCKADELRRENDFADVLSLFHVTVGIGDLLEGKYAIDMRANQACGDAARNLLGPGADLFAFVPHVTEIQAEDAFVAIHQPDGIVTGHLRDGFEGANLPPDSRGRCDRSEERRVGKECRSRW